MKNTILEFGKFKGKKYIYVLRKHKDYCLWILENLDYKVADKPRKDFYDFLNINRVSPAHEDFNSNKSSIYRNIEDIHKHLKFFFKNSDKK